MRRARASGKESLEVWDSEWSHDRILPPDFDSRFLFLDWGGLISSFLWSADHRRSSPGRGNVGLRSVGPLQQHVTECCCSELQPRSCEKERFAEEDLSNSAILFARFWQKSSAHW